MPKPSPLLRPVALLLTVLTGICGLVYEVTWQKYLAILLGSHGEATAAVLAIFLGGLAGGYALFGKLSVRVVRAAGGRHPGRRLLLLYAAAEAGIGILAFGFPLLFDAAQVLSVAGPAGGAAGFGFDVALAALLIGPPSVLMGATIPVLTQALTRSLADATRFHAFVYACNTAGAFVGALAAAFWLVPALGLVGVLQAMGSVNLMVGLAFAALAGAAASGPAAAAGAGERGSPPPPPAATAEGVTLYAWVAGLNGFAMLAIQTVLIRLGGLAFGSSHFTFAMVVAAFVLCIALGSFAVSALPRIPRAAVVWNQWAVALLLLALYAPLADLPYFAHLLRSLFRDTDASFYPFYGAAFAAMIVGIGLPVIAAGAVLPLLFHQLRRELGDLGGVAGRLYAANTVGSLLGALLGGYLFYFVLDLHAVYRVAVAALLIAAALLGVRAFAARGRAVVASALALSLGGLAWLAPWPPERLAAGVFRLRHPTVTTLSGPAAFFASLEAPEIVFYTDDPTASIAVKQYADVAGRPSRSVFNNGKSDGNIPEDITTMSLAALLPALFSERVERSFVIGYGTGVTVGELAQLPEAREVVVAEISRGVMQAAPWFDYGNFAASRDSKVTSVRSDAYRALLGSRGVFDVIASEPSNPWVTGVEMLYSREFLAAVRDRLAPGGVFAQWIHTYEIDAPTLDLVLRTTAGVFDAVSVWYAQGSDLILLGFADGRREPDLPRLLQRFAQPALRAGFARAGIDSVPALLAHELLPLGVVHALDLAGPVHTLLHPRLAHSAARAFHRGLSDDRPLTAHRDAALVGARNSLFRRYVASRPDGFGSRERRAFARETCRYRTEECAVVLAHWALVEPGSPALERLLRNSRARPELEAVLAPANLAQLAALFADVAPRTRPVALSAVKRATETFARYYTHAQPFERRALAEAWNACSDAGDGAACRADRAVAERLLGPLADP